MIDGIPPGFLDNIGVVGGAVLIVLGFATGRLFTKRQYDEVINDRDNWRAESRIKDAQLAEKDTQLGHMAEVGRNVLAIMNSIKQYPSDRDEVT